GWRLRSHLDATADCDAVALGKSCLRPFMLFSISTKGPLHDGLDHRLLALVVIDDCRLADTRFPGNGIKRQACHAIARDHSLSGIQNRLVVDDALAAHPAIPIISERMVRNWRCAVVK